jgi:hypothetical protein
MADMGMATDELLELVKARLHDEWLMSLGDGEDDNRMQDWHTAHPASPEVAAQNLMRYRYQTAKRSAQAGNVEPLREILTRMANDPDIAKFIRPPPAPLRPKYARKTPNPFWNEAEERQQQVETLLRIRQIVRQEIGKTRDTRNTVIDIATKVMKCSPQRIQELMKRGH